MQIGVKDALSSRTVRERGAGMHWNAGQSPSGSWNPFDLRNLIPLCLSFMAASRFGQRTPVLLGLGQ